MEKTVVTHTSPDWDAIASAWLLARFEPQFAMARFTFVGANEDESETVAQADAVVDVGRQIDPVRFRFDHHMEQLGKTTCATKQVYEYLCQQKNEETTDRRLRALAPLVDLIFKADTGQNDLHTEESYTLGLHALLSGEKKRLRANASPLTWDTQALTFGFGILENISRVLEDKLRHHEEPRGNILYTSTDGLLCAVRGGFSNDLFEKGVVLVVYEGDPIVVSSGETTFPVGVSRSFEAKAPHIGDLIEKVLQEKEDLEELLRSEVSSWWRHPAGFMAGRGSARAPRSTPVTIDITEFAKILDKAWVRCGE